MSDTADDTIEDIVETVDVSSDADEDDDCTLYAELDPMIVYEGGVTPGWYHPTVVDVETDIVIRLKDRYCVDVTDPDDNYDPNLIEETFDAAVSMLRHDIEYWMSLYPPQFASTPIFKDYDNSCGSLTYANLHLVFALQKAYFNGRDKLDPNFVNYWVETSHIQAKDIWVNFNEIYHDPRQPDHIHAWLYRVGIWLKNILAWPLKEMDQIKSAETTPAPATTTTTSATHYDRDMWEGYM